MVTDHVWTWTIARRGARAAWPICLGYLPIGLAFGVVAQKAGLSPFEIGLMSLLVFAGSSQFIAVSMLASGAGFLPVVWTTLAVNLRHVLMSSALAVYLKPLSRPLLALFAYGVTDESFAVNMMGFRTRKLDWQVGLWVNLISSLAWCASTVIGGYGGILIPSRSFGIDYALVAMLLCLLALQLRTPTHIVVALISAIVAVLLALALPGNWYVIMASVVGATAGLLLKRQRRGPEDRGGI